MHARRRFSLGAAAALLATAGLLAGCSGPATGGQTSQSSGGDPSAQTSASATTPPSGGSSASPSDAPSAQASGSPSTRSGEDPAASENAKALSLAQSFAEATGLCAREQLAPAGEFSRAFRCGPALVGTSIQPEDEFKPQAAGEAVVKVIEPMYNWLAEWPAKTGDTATDRIGTGGASAIFAKDGTANQLVVIVGGEPAALGVEAQKKLDEFTTPPEAVRWAIGVDSVWLDQCRPVERRPVNFPIQPGVSFVLADGQLYATFTKDLKDRTAALNRLAQDLSKACGYSDVDAVQGEGWAMLASGKKAMQEIAAEHQGKFVDLKPTAAG